MGSGSSGSYHGTKGGSQPLADSYHVVSSAMKADMKDPDIYHPTTGYFKNPTAISLEDAIQGNRIYIDGKKQMGSITYVMNTNGKIILGIRRNPNDTSKRCPHPTLIGGKDPTVQCAGMITFTKGRIASINAASGHFKPNRGSLPKVHQALQKLCDKYPDLFAKSSEWRKKK
ncbi:MAG: hypothetical protein IJZ23_09650 [Roseburia sp.]|nr:hypothetical protein [Roseburia sp.]